MSPWICGTPHMKWMLNPACGGRKTKFIMLKSVTRADVHLSRGQVMKRRQVWKWVMKTDEHRDASLPHDYQRNNEPFTSHMRSVAFHYLTSNYKLYETFHYTKSFVNWNTIGSVLHKEIRGTCCEIVPQICLLINHKSRTELIIIIIMDENGEWRRLHNEEHSLYRSPNIVRVIKSKRLRWAGHVAKMEEDRSAFKIFKDK